MGILDLPFTLIEFAQVNDKLESNDSFCTKSISSLDDSIVNYGESFFQDHNHDAIAAYISEDTYSDHFVKINTDKEINFIFIYSGSNLIHLSDRILRSSTVDVLFIINPKVHSFIQKAGERKRALSFGLSSTVLIEKYGLDIINIPEYLREAILGNNKSTIAAKIRLPAIARLSLESIFETSKIGSLFRRYVFAKSEELVCEAVYLINNIYAGQSSSSYLSPEERLLQKLNHASYLYRQSVGRHITNEEICRQVGLNRNTLNSGFKEVFGQTPAEYARVQTLTWARSQIDEGRQSIKSVATATGYSGISDFVRAYVNQLGRTPLSNQKRYRE